MQLNKRTSWTDKFTGVRYEMNDKWMQKVRQHLANMLHNKLQKITDAREAADTCACFWQGYYELVFPLRFGKDQNGEGLLSSRPLFGKSEQINLEQYLDKELRCSFLDATCLPPLLPSSPNELIADHHLTCAAIVNAVLRAQDTLDEVLLHQLRLGILLHELSDEEPLKSWLMQQHLSAACQTAQFLCGEGEPPNGVDRVLLDSIHKGQVAESLRLPNVFLVAAGVQRIKQFVFESPGLNEIRGASTLLDYCVDELKRQVSAELGPEVVLRAVASTLEFLAPFDKDTTDKAWTEQLKEHFYRRTGTAFIAAAAHSIAPARLFTNFSEEMRELRIKLEHDRYNADLPITDTLPFELRCNLCRIRPAEGWYRPPEGQPTPVCRVCITKRQVGRIERGAKVKDVLNWLGLDDPISLGVNGRQPKEYTAQDLDNLMPQELAHKRLAAIYGDGNNFGAIVGNLSSLALGLQWTHRVEKTTQAAVALALALATKEAADEQPGKWLEKLPFQVLALSGDDLSLLTWGRIGLRLCEQFLYLTDLEFQQGSAEKLCDKPLSFSLGMLFCDEKAPVRRTVNFAETDLLQWAKRAVRKQEKGNVAFLLAMTAEQIPADLNEYRRKMFLRENKLCLTLRPFTARELSFLLHKARVLKEHHSGQLHRLIEAFIQSTPYTAMLHYIYQKEREQEKGIIQLMEAPRDDWQNLFQGFPLPAAMLPNRLPFGEDNEAKSVSLFSPLWDLLEMVKILE